MLGRTISFERLKSLIGLDKSEPVLVEGSTVDFKLKLEPRLYLSPICAFANTNGGKIIIGVKESQGRATDAPGVPAPSGDLATYFANVLGTGIVPPLKYSVDEVEIPGSSNKIIILNIPKSESAPHVPVSKKAEPIHRERILWRYEDKTEPAPFAHVENLFASRRLPGSPESGMQFRSPITEVQPQNFLMCIQIVPCGREEMSILTSEHIQAIDYMAANQIFPDMRLLQTTRGPNINRRSPNQNGDIVQSYGQTSSKEAFNPLSQPEKAEWLYTYHLHRDGRCDLFVKGIQKIDGNENQEFFLDYFIAVVVNFVVAAGNAFPEKGLRNRQNIRVFLNSGRGLSIRPFSYFIDPSQPGVAMEDLVRCFKGSPSRFRLQHEERNLDVTSQENLIQFLTAAIYNLSKNQMTELLSRETWEGFVKSGVDREIVYLRNNNVEVEY